MPYVEKGKDVQKVYAKFPLDISNIDTRGRAIVGRYVENYEDLDLSSCVFYGCFPAEIENGLCINPETFPETLLLNDQDFSGLDLEGLDLSITEEIRNVDFSNANLRNSHLEDLNVHESDFRCIDLMHAAIVDCTFTNCDFSNTGFEGSSIGFKAIGCNFEHSEFRHYEENNVGFEDCNLRNCTFAAAFFTFENCDLSYSEFTDPRLLPWFSDDCKIEGVTLVNCDMRGEASDYIDYSGINLSDISSISGIFSFVDFKGANLQSVEFFSYNYIIYLKHIDFENANLEGALFRGVEFESGVSFKNANLSYAKFQNCEGLENVDFEGADLSNAEYDEKDAKYFIESDFSGKSLIGQDFSDEDNMEYIFTEADLESADFRNSYLVGVDFENANLKNANFQGATLTRCNLKYANLEYANLEFTNIEWADMKGSDVSFADFTLAKYNSGTILPSSITQSQIDSMTLTDAQDARENSRGISVDFKSVSNLVDDIRDYIWNNWNDLNHTQSTTILKGYETQFVNAKNELVTIPINIVMTEDDAEDLGLYDPATGIIYVYLETKSLPNFAQILNPNRKHPKWNTLRTHLITVLVHELTHALDAEEEIARKRNKYNIINDRYYNTPLEVNAYANQIIAEIMMSGKTYKTVEDALKSSEAWQDSKYIWSTKSKRTIMKRVYSRLFED